MSGKEEFKVLNLYRGRASGKRMFQAQKMALKYVEEYLGKPIRIIQCDHEKIEQLEKKIDEKDAQLERIEGINFELEQNLIAAENQNHYYKLMGTWRDRALKAEQQNKQLAAAIVDIETIVVTSHDKLVDNYNYDGCKFDYNETVVPLAKGIKKHQEAITLAKQILEK